MVGCEGGHEPTARSLEKGHVAAEAVIAHQVTVGNLDDDDE
jgi:hypothetical protein